MKTDKDEFMGKLSDNILMTGIPAGVVASLEKKARKFESKPGETIFAEGDPGSEIYLIGSGTVQVLKKFQEDRVVLLDELKENDFLGELALLDRQGRSATAKAVTRVTGWTFDDSIFDVMISAGKDAAIPFMKALALRMRRLDLCLIRHRESAERLTLLGNMVGSIVHDLKNPLAAMRMSGELLEMKAPDDKSKKIATLMVQQIDKLTSMTQDLLEFARDKIELQKAAGKVDDLVAHCRDFYNDVCKAGGVELEVKLAAPRSIQMDPSKLERVLSNLVKNAVQALKGRQDGKIGIETRQTAKQTMIEVLDNGPGVPETIRNMLFEPFVTAGKKGGTGLGLSVVKKTIEAHGGTVGFDSTPDKGTSFHIVLPG